MKKRDLWKLSLLNIFASPLRSVLTILGMAIGVGAILAVLTLGEAGKMQVRSEMARLGIDRVWLTASQEKMLRQGGAQLLSEALGVEAAEAVYLNAEISCGQTRQMLMVVGCDAAYLRMNGAELLHGRMLWPLEWSGKGNCVVLGEKAAQMLHASAGSRIYLMGKAFQVCGVINVPDGISGTDAQAAAFVPLGVTGEMSGGNVHEIVLGVSADTSPEEIALLAQNVLKLHNTPAQAVTLQLQMEAAQSVITTFVEVLKWVALVCVLVGGIGVMNILLVSVRERRREIGIMKSLGTTHCQICTLFLLEAASYALTGGLLGIVLGHVLILAAGKSIGLNARAGGADCICVLLAALATGLFFGVAPASRAAGLQCVEALREE